MKTAQVNTSLDSVRTEEQLTAWTL